MVSRAILEANFNATTLSANNCSVQRARPRGGVLHAMATRSASCLPVNMGPCPRRGRSVRQPKPSSTKRLRVRSTVANPVLSNSIHWFEPNTQIGAQIRTNPVLLARPKAPRAYQTDSTKAWTDEELQAIVAAVESRAAGDDLVGKRDLALLRMYMATGRRREEIISLRGRDVRLIDDGLEVGGRMKGGRYRTMKIEDPEVKAALLDYLSNAKRLHVLKTDAPLWTRHDHPKFAGGVLTSYAFVKNLKGYARTAGVGDVHLHQTRHTFARIVQETTGSFNETQEALDHENLATTRVYVQRIAVKADKHSRKIAERMRQSRSS